LLEHYSLTFLQHFQRVVFFLFPECSLKSSNNIRHITDTVSPSSSVGSLNINIPRLTSIVKTLSTGQVREMTETSFAGLVKFCRKSRRWQPISDAHLITCLVFIKAFYIL